MGLFDFLKKTTPINDNVFGALKVVGSNKDSFSGTCLFKPLGIEIHISIKADTSGPTTKHQQFYKSIEDNYPQLKSKIIPILQDTFRNWKDDFTINDFDSEFILSSISLPHQDTGPFKWQICYYTSDDNDDHDFTIFVNEFEPEEGVAIDG